MPAHTDPTTAAPPSSPGVSAPAPRASYVRRHPILAAFGILSGLSLFAALWPFSAVVVGVAVAGHATGADSVAWSATRRVAVRCMAALRRRHVPSTPVAPEPVASPGPRRPAPARVPGVRGGEITRSLRAPRRHPSTAPRRRPTKVPHEVRVESGVDGPSV